MREELDRLASHVAAARALMAEDAAAGRRLDFLTQEFMREANTLCSKSATTGLTATGLALKAVDRSVPRAGAECRVSAPRRGLMLVISSPSGAGKTSLSRRLVADHADLDLSISMTTRAPAAGRGRWPGVSLRQPATRSTPWSREGGFLEWAEVHEHGYGTPQARR